MVTTETELVTVHSWAALQAVRGALLNIYQLEAFGVSISGKDTTMDYMVKVPIRLTKNRTSEVKAFITGVLYAHRAAF
jgi:hypothetical protein